MSDVDVVDSDGPPIDGDASAPDSDATRDVAEAIEADTTESEAIEDATSTDTDEPECVIDDCGPSPAVTVTGGSFAMGSPAAEAGRGSDEPTHQVIVADFSIDQREVTNRDYLACVVAEDCEPPTTCEAGTPVWTGARSFPAAAAEEPVRCIAWQMAADYCAFTGRRLCTEAEWERACIGGPSHRVYPWGDAWPIDPDLHANCKEGYCNDGYEFTSPVGALSAGAVPEGEILDMAGNVGEWVLDYYDADTYTTGAQDNPKGPCDGATPCDGRFVRVHRGGSYAVTDAFIRCASRGQRIETNREPYLGIRCCADAPVER